MLGSEQKNKIDVCFHVSLVFSNFEPFRPVAPNWIRAEKANQLFSTQMILSVLSICSTLVYKKFFDQQKSKVMFDFTHFMLAQCSKNSPCVHNVLKSWKKLQFESCTHGLKSKYFLIFIPVEWRKKGFILWGNYATSDAHIFYVLHYYFHF